MLPETTSTQVVRRLEGEGAEVQLTGKVRSGKQGQRAGWVGGVLCPPPPHSRASPLFILDGHWPAPAPAFWSSAFSQEGGGKRERVGQGFSTVSAGTSGPLLSHPEKTPVSGLESVPHPHGLLVLGPERLAV